MESQDQNTNETEATNATESTNIETPNSRAGGDLLSGNETRTSSPFDSVFQKGALDQFPEDLKGLRNWIESQKSGVGLEKGLRHLQKLASSKGFERPADDAPDDAKEAFTAKLRELNGVPESPDKYEFKMPEGYEMPDEVKGKIAEFAHTNGINAETVNKFIPFQMELEKAGQLQSQQAHIEAESKRGDEYFGGEGSFDVKAPEIAKWAQEQGYDIKGDPAFRNATTYKILADLKAATSEDNHVSGSGAGNGINGLNTESAIRDKLHALRSGDNRLATAWRNKDRRSPDYAEAKSMYLDLTKKLHEVQSRTKSV